MQYVLTKLVIVIVIYVFLFCLISNDINMYSQVYF